MQKLYSLFYILNSFYPEHKEEILLDFNSVCERNEILNELPEYEPSNSVLEEIFKFL